MAGIVDATEAQIAVFTHNTTNVRVVRYDWRIASSIPWQVCRSCRTGDCERDRLAAKPIANVVSISINKCYPDTGIQQLHEVLNDTAPCPVSRFIERLKDGQRVLRVIDRDANGLLHCLGVEVLEVVRIWKRIEKVLRDVVD